jgi:polysaccharide deacetylase 2 family uncharacterized protein YibQ
MKHKQKKRSRGSAKIQWPMLAIIILSCVIALEAIWLLRTNQQRRTAVKSRAVKITPAVPAPQPKAPVPQPAEVRKIPSQGKIAVIIDDSGYSIEDCSAMDSIDYPVTVSILPDLAYSRKIAQCAHNLGKEVMLHLPMEAHKNNDKYPEHYIISSKMDASQVAGRIKDALSSVPFAEGINNHMGSKATENKQLMSLIFSEIKNRNLFFVDSRVTTKTICGPLAREIQIPFAERDVFLDNQHERAKIEEQFSLLAAEARRQGYAIGIGHARSLTWKIVREQLKKLSEEGFEIVPVKTLTNKQPL